MDSVGHEGRDRSHAAGKGRLRRTVTDQRSSHYINPRPSHAGQQPQSVVCQAAR